MRLSILTSSAFIILAALTNSCGATNQKAPNCITYKPIKVSAPFEMPVLKTPVFPDRVFNIMHYGAVEGGSTRNTAAIRKAVAACHQAGGGTVLVPEGKWLTGPVHLKSDVNFRVAKDAELHFSDVFGDYLPVVLTRWEGMECYNYSPLIYAVDCENIAVTGEGKLIGHGQKWWSWKQTQVKMAVEKLNEMSAAGSPVKDRRFGIEKGLRPQFIQFFRCKNVLIEGLTIEDGPFWTVHPVYCENIIVRGLSIHTNGPNTDGVNLDSCKYGLVEHCYFVTGDDSVCLKSGINEDGWRVNKPCEYIVIRHCKTEKGHGAVVIGSEMSGGVQYIYAHDMHVKVNDRAIRIKSMRGRGGFVRNVYYEDFKVDKVHLEVVQINMKYASSTVIPKSQRVPVFENIFIKNISCGEANVGVRLIGLPEQKIRNVTLENISIQNVRQKQRIIEHVENLIEIESPGTQP